MAGLMTLNCIHNHYAGPCTSKLCNCECHQPKETPSLLHTYREEAHQAVKAFDLKPSPETASVAIAALQMFIGVHSA
jgi:hypothetical protein